MAPTNGKVSTKTFYEALLEIAPQLQKINDNLDRLNTESRDRTVQINAIITRVVIVERAQLKDGTRRQTWGVIGKILYAVAILGIGLAGAVIGKSL